MKDLWHGAQVQLGSYQHMNLAAVNIDMNGRACGALAITLLAAINTDISDFVLKPCLY